MQTNIKGFQHILIYYIHFKRSGLASLIKSRQNGEYWHICTCNLVIEKWRERETPQWS